MRERDCIKAHHLMIPKHTIKDGFVQDSFYGSRTYVSVPYRIQSFDAALIFRRKDGVLN